VHIAGIIAPQRRLGEAAGMHDPHHLRENSRRRRILISDRDVKLTTPSTPS
jgi:hypothetical protein